MFEVGFSEILLIFAIALLVLGPNRLPKLAADIGRWAGRARSMARQLRTQLEQEVNYDPLKDATASPAPAETVSPPPFPAQPASVPAAEAAVVNTAEPIATSGDATTAPQVAPATGDPAPAAATATPDRTDEPKPQ